MSNEKTPSTVIGITVSAEMAAKLETAFFGLPTQRQDLILENQAKIGRPQAIFNEILTPKLESYFEKGAAAIDKIYLTEIESTVQRTKKPWNEVAQFLGLAQYCRVESQKESVVAVPAAK